MAGYMKPLMSNSEISRAIRMKKKKIMTSEPEMIDTAPTPDLDANKVADIERNARAEQWVGDDGMKSNSDEAMLDMKDPEPMSKENMKSHVQPMDHGRMAYGGMAEEHADPMMPSMESEEMIGGSSGGESESHRMFSNRPSVGTGEGQSEMLGSGLESEEDRRIKMRKMRLSDYLDSLGM